MNVSTITQPCQLLLITSIISNIIIVSRANVIAALAMEKWISYFF
jgi:hypothetical protein